MGTQSPQGGGHKAPLGTGGARTWPCQLAAGSHHDRGCRSGWCQSRSRWPQSSSSDTCTPGSQCHAWGTPEQGQEETNGLHCAPHIGTDQRLAIFATSSQLVFPCTNLHCSSDIGTGGTDQLSRIVVITGRSLLSTACLSTIVCLCVGCVGGVGGVWVAWVVWVVWVVCGWRGWCG